MNPFLNSNSASWRGQPAGQNRPQTNGTAPQNNFRTDSTNAQNCPRPDNTDAQNIPRPDNTDAQNIPRPDNTNAQNIPRPDNANPQNFASGPSWMENPALSGIDPARLQMLSSLAAQAQGKSQKELLPFLMAAASQTNANGMSFQPDEIDAIIHVMKIGKSPQEIQQIERICTLMRQFGAMRGRGRRH